MRWYDTKDEKISIFKLLQIGGYPLSKVHWEAMSVLGGLPSGLYFNHCENEGPYKVYQERANPERCS